MDTNKPFWDQTGDADGSSAGNYFPPVDAEYDVEIGAVKHKTGHEGQSVIVELRVIGSNNPEIPVGTSKSTAWNLTKHKEMALNNVKSFVCGIYGISEGDKSPETKARVNLISKRMVEADNPLMSAKVHLTTWNKPTKKNAPFTACKWAPYTAEPGYAAPMPSGSAAPFVPVSSANIPPPPPTETYHPQGTRPGAGATHVLRNGGWVAL